MKFFRSPNIPNVTFQGDPQRALNFLRALGRLWTIWPLDENASRLSRIYHEFCLWFIIINLFFTSITLWMSVCNCHKYPILMAKNLSQLMIINDSFTHLLFYRIYRSSIRVLLQEIFDYMKSCKPYEKLVLKEHYKRFLGQYTTLIVLYTSAALAFFCGALILKKKFPVDASYPFSTDSPLISTIIYTHQTFGIVQNSVIIMIDLLFITLFWYAGARIKILGYRFECVKTERELNEFISEHQKIIKYVQRTVNTVRLALYKTISIVGIILISAGLQLLYFDAKTVISQFSLIIIVANLRIINYCSTIDEMKLLNENLQWTVYKSNWLQNSRRTNRNLLIFLQRCQSPLIIVNGRMLNVMSLQFFAKFIYLTISHLTTLRAIIERSTTASVKK